MVMSKYLRMMDGLVAISSKISGDMRPFDTYFSLQFIDFFVLNVNLNEFVFEFLSVESQSCTIW